MRRKVLIAEGNAGLRSLYRQALADRGYEVETVSDGLECLEVLRNSTPAVLVLDLGLFWGGGEGVLAWLREEGRGSSPPVILTTDPAYTYEAAIFHDSPVVACLPKPITAAALLKNVQTVLFQTASSKEFRKTIGPSPFCRPDFPSRVFEVILFEAEAACRRLDFRSVREMAARI